MQKHFFFFFFFKKKKKKSSSSFLISLYERRPHLINQVWIWALCQDVAHLKDVIISEEGRAKHWILDDLVHLGYELRTILLLC